MASATLLLQLALSLLIAAQQPNVPEDLKIRAIGTAEYAIAFAMTTQELASVDVIPARGGDAPVEHRPEQVKEPTCSVSYEVLPSQSSYANIVVSWKSENATIGWLDGRELTPVESGTTTVSTRRYLGQEIELSFNGDGGNGRCKVRVQS